ncbi:5028_t:CDS:2 [Funneliformis geosporum]|uniref:14128_t:CDS:1 n=1 Tax=Funneliformis geosporum TaxID=1117311 RepID=A0A9W4SMH8_9GLOM|nr:5028_t:CDS:2 [Funneliformis geosporum]CAI2172408.1 14128_t:CDS:2 [Funneliformis geosporum]
MPKFWNINKLLKKKNKTNQTNIVILLTPPNSSKKAEAEYDSDFERKCAEKLNLGDTPEDLVLKSFAKKLSLENIAENKEELKKFYDYAHPDFAWHPTFEFNERLIIFDYIVNPDWGSAGKELVTNTIAYRKLLESKSLDASKGTHILLINGQIVRYGNEISSECYDQLDKENPGMFYAPIVEPPPLVIRGVSATVDSVKKEWQVHICLRNAVNALDEVIMENNEDGFRMIMDTGSTMTIIPYSLRQRLHSSREGWKSTFIKLSGYGENTNVYKASRPWLICLGDGVNWTKWVKTDEIYSWQCRTSCDIDCGLVGFDVLNSIPHYKRIGRPYKFLENDDIFDQFELNL